MIEYFQKDIFRINHALKVYEFAEIISESLDLDDKQKKIIYLAAILHDIGIKEAERKYNSSKGKFQEIEGPPIAKEILTEINVSEKIKKRVIFIIGNHHSYQKIDDIDFQILVEADILVNIFEEEMNKKSIDRLYKERFQTTPGKNLIKTMYLD
jgi:HD superfamily phosphodiesterase